MKHLASLVLVSLSTLLACQKIPESSSNYPPHYNEVDEYHIFWEDLFGQKEEQYFIYIYSLGCTSCSLLREMVVDFAQKNHNLYFVYPNDDIPFNDDIEASRASKGAQSVEQIYIYTTPTLIEIQQKIVNQILIGYDEIQSFIES